MVFRRESIEARLLKLDEALKVLEGYRTLAWDSYRTDIKTQWVVERGFIIVAEMIFDIGAHILSSIYREYKDDYAGIITGMADKGVISVGTAAGLDGFGGFRNVLIHEYVSVDAKKVYEAVATKLDVIRGFEKDLTLWLSKQK